MIRISCATLNRIQYRDKRFLVVLNGNRLRSGRRVLTPIGGASRYYDPCVLESLGARPERHGSQDLRFFIDESKVPKFEAWFRTRSGRETGPFRELYEELVLEEGLIGNLGKQDIDVRFAGLVTTQHRSTRDIAGGALTKYFFEVFRVVLSEELWDEILRGITSPTSRARLVSATEIKASRTLDGIEIGENCLALVEV